MFGVHLESQLALAGRMLLVSLLLVPIAKAQSIDSAPRPNAHTPIRAIMHTDRRGHDV